MEEQTIDKCLYSIVHQDFDSTDYEIILSDAMSSDKTVEIARRYAANIVQTAKRGISIGRNNGAKQAKGDILLFIDADCHLKSDFLSNMDKAFNSSEIVTATGLAYPDDGSFIARFVYLVTFILVRLFGFFGLYLFPGVCVAYRRWAFENLNGFREDFGIVEDLDLSKRISKIGKCRIVPEAKVYVSTRRLKKHLWSTVFFHIYSDIKYLLTGKATSHYPKVEEIKSWKDLWQQK